MAKIRRSARVSLTLPLESIERRIYIIRGQRVMLDVDLGHLYQVPTKLVNLAVRRNRDRFPDDFMFQLRQEEFEDLRLQNATSSWGGRRYSPYVFTEHGVAMLSSVLKSSRAVQMNILTIRAFIKLREMLANNKELARKIENLERQQKQHSQQLGAVYSIVKQLIEAPGGPKRNIGFTAGDRS
jgi:hypothetical protein